MGSSTSTPGKKRPVVIVIGGGYAGMKFASAVDASGLYEVIVIDRKNYFAHNVGFLRAAVQPDFINRVAIPYDRALKNGLVIQAYVTGIQPADQTITLSGWPKPVYYDHVVIATGSSYAFPGKLHEPNLSELPPRFHEVSRQLKAATAVAIIGGGAVGTELAGEIATDFPGKQVRLIHATNTLVQAALPDAAQKNVQRELTKLGVILHLNQRVVIDEDLVTATGLTHYAVGPRTLVTSDGTRINADLVVFAVGPEINSDVYKTAFADQLQGERLLVNDYFQVGRYQNVYAVGDCAFIENPQAAFGGQQAEWLAKNLIAQAKGRKLKPYKRTDAPLIVVSIGRKSGAGWAFGMNFSAWFTAMVKSGDMFASKFLAEMHHKVGAPRQPPTEQQLRNAELSLGLSSTELDTLVRGLPIETTVGVHV